MRVSNRHTTMTKILPPLLTAVKSNIFFIYLNLKRWRNFKPVYTGLSLSLSYSMLINFM